MSRRVLQTVLAAVSVWLGSTAVQAQAVTIVGGNQTMTVTTAVIGSQPTAVTNTTVRVRIRQQAVITKVTARTSCPGQSFNLSVVATSTPVGTIMPEITLVDGMLAADLVTNIPADNRNRTIRVRYTASATFAQGTSAEMGSDVHTITYTLIAQ